MDYSIGATVISKVHRDKGYGTIIGFSGFDNELVDVIYETGQKIVCRLEDLEEVKDVITSFINGRFSSPHAFVCRFLSVLLQGRLTEKSLVSSVNYKIQPLPHQLLAVDFVMNRFRPRCLIADEVGLGKTIEAILVFQEYKLRGMAKRTLIVVPSGLVLQWHEELVSKFNEHFVIYNTEYVKTLKQSFGEDTNVWKLNDKIIVSMDTIKPGKIPADLLSDNEVKKRQWHNKNMFEDVLRAGFDIVIIDEAHKLSKKNDRAESLRFKLGRQLSRVVPVFILLSATPHQGDEDLFFHLLQLVDPVLFSDRKMLTPELVKEVCVRNKKRAVVDFDGKRIFKHRLTSFCNITRTSDENREELLLYDLVTEYVSDCYNIAVRKNNQFLVMLVMLFQRIASSSSFAIEKSMKRRKSFLESLKQKQNGSKDAENEKTDVVIIDDKEADALFTHAFSGSLTDIEHEIDMVDRCIEAAEKITSVFKDKKLKTLIDLIEKLKIKENDPDLKLIIFTEFRPTQDGIIRFLEKFGYECAFINGSLSREAKNEQVALFREKKQILVSTDAGGEGINLQFCHCIVNFDLPWNPSRLEQRIGRIDRIGQQHNCLVFNFRLTDTIEDRVREILETKLDLIKEQFGEDRYADVLDVLEDEFSFEKIYVDAINKKEKEDAELESYAVRIFERAKEILQKGDLLIPFSETDEKMAAKLINSSNHLIRKMIFSFLQSQKISINEYKSEKGLFYFKNPFSGEEQRYITFDPEISFKSEKYELLNLEHPLLEQVNSYIKKTDDFGMVSAICFDINKFSGIHGLWFVFMLTITNNIDKTYTTILSVFMEDEEFCNNRISAYLNKGVFDKYDIVQNYRYSGSIDLIKENAFNHARKKAKDIFLATKLDWINEIEKYEKKAEEYFAHRKNLISRIKVDNIRISREKKNIRQREKEIELLKRKKVIVPDLRIGQIAYVEFR